MIKPSDMDEFVTSAPIVDDGESHAPTSDWFIFDEYRAISKDDKNKLIGEVYAEVKPYVDDPKNANKFSITWDGNPRIAKEVQKYVREVVNKHINNYIANPTKQQITRIVKRVCNRIKSRMLTYDWFIDVYTPAMKKEAEAFYREAVDGGVETSKEFNDVSKFYWNPKAPNRIGYIGYGQPTFWYDEKDDVVRVG